MKVLIVEDSSMINNMLYSELSNMGHECTQSFTMSETRKILENTKQDLVILDLHLPDGEGEELFEVFKDQDDTKIIIYTADDDLEKRSYFFQHGVIDYLSKNSPAQQLIASLDESIKRLEMNKNKNILIVDDSFVVRKQLSHIFKLRNFNILTATNIKEALELASKNHLSFAIVDLVLPDGDGTTLIQELQKQESNNKLPIIAISGTSDSATIKLVYKSGASDFLKKPIIYEELVLKTDIWIDMICKDCKSKYNEKLLQEYKDAIDNSEIVSKTNKNGIITYVNSRFCKISGYDSIELVGKPHNAVRHPDMKKEVFENLWRTIQKKKSWRGIIKNLAKDGSAYWVDSTITPIIDSNGEITEYIAIRHDVTMIERMKDELSAQLQSSNKNLWDMLALKTTYENAINASNILTRTDTKGLITFANEEFSKISGYTREEVIGKSHNIVRHPDNDNAFFADIWDKIKDGKTWKGIIKNRAKDGHDYYVDSTIIPITNSDGEIVEYMAIRHDVTSIIKLTDELQLTQQEIVSRMGNIAESRCKETAYHTMRVAEYSVLFGRKVGLCETDIDILYAASPMHDIGKVGIPDHILLKPGKLNDEEWVVMKTHSELGYKVFENSELPILKAAATIALQHHEKYDGNGYPKGVKGDDIHIFARITALADVFDALGSDREYKKAWELDKILELIKSESGKHFDPKLVEIFFANIDEIIKIKNKYID